MWGGLSFQDSCSYVMEQLIYFHDHCLVILFFVSYLVLYFVFLGAISDFYDKGVREGHEIEFIWTLLPASFLIAVALPSLKILYLIDEDFGKSLTYKITGHQWYWSYEYSDYVGYREDGFISSREIFRLFTTEERLLVPFFGSFTYISYFPGRNSFLSNPLYWGKVWCFTRTIKSTCFWF